MTDLVTPHDLNKELVRMSGLLDEALEELYRRSHDWAQKENTYRLAKANAILAASGTVVEKEAHRDKATSKEREDAHLAEALKVAALEAVRSRRAQLSALQSIGAATRTEMEFAGRYEGTA